MTPTSFEVVDNLFEETGQEMEKTGEFCTLLFIQLPKFKWYQGIKIHSFLK